VITRQRIGGAAALVMLAAAASPAGVRPRPRTRPARLRGPVVSRIPIPSFPGAYAIWGATGRDARGHIWFGVTSHGSASPSARLFEYVPQSGKVIARGDVLGALKRSGLARAGQRQAKIHSRIVQAGDGHLYFASMDETGESQSEQVPPKWGSHLWRLRLPEAAWEHLLAAPEGLIAVAGGGRHVYALGYFTHRLYQYDCKSGRRRSVEVGSYAGHVSRNFFTDRAGHAYVPRLRAPARRRDRPRATLVEFDTSLREIAQTELKRYLTGRPARSEGITAFQELPDGRIAFLTSGGHLHLVEPSRSGPAKVIRLGWFYPDGWSQTRSLFADSAGRLAGLSTRWGDFEWVVYDLKTRSGRAGPFRVSRPESASLVNAWVYGSVTRDDAGNYYVGGAVSAGGEREPVLLQVRPAGRETRKAD